ncbi:hypothetical protein NKF26_22245 [Haladaptatus sp. AB618]|uniref:hypothetical protein n=1 Tax=Haladaptatus sp. AB618 TaxID=2934173 RepID=UPI00209C6C71|nr:hypothetical protein [Haladaptatus sp. AB618]MCO8256542.1 hypothetical protein [Haladaptatus sp. AB618]
MQARPAREATEAVTVALCRFSVVFVLRWEGLECPAVGCIFDGGYVFAKGVPVNVVRARTGHQFVGHIVAGGGVLVGCGVLVALVGDFDESGGIDVEGKSFDLYNLELFYISDISFSLVHSIATGESHPS